MGDVHFEGHGTDAGLRLCDICLGHDVTEQDIALLKRKEVLETEDLTLLLRLVHDTFEISTLLRSGVANVSLLLLVNLAGVHNLFYRTRGDESEHFNIAALTNTIGSILGLKIVGWIPVRIHNYNFVRGCDIQTNTTGTRGNKEDKLIRVRIEVCDGLGTIFIAHASVQVGEIVFRPVKVEQCLHQSQQPNRV